MLEIFCNSNTLGGAERFSQILNQNIDSRVFTSEILKTNFTNSIPINIGPKISKRSFDFLKFKSYRLSILKNLKSNSSLFTQFKKEQILIGNSQFDIFKRFTFEHGPLHPLLKIHPILWNLYKKSLKQYNFRFCGSLATKSKLESDLNLNFEHIPYGIKFKSLLDIDLRTQLRKELGLSDTDIVVCFADRPLKERGFNDLLSLLQKKKYNLKFFIFGSQIPQYVSPNDIRFFGFVDNLDHYLMICDYFLNLSTAYGEAFPLRLLQALMAGNGIISCEGDFVSEMEKDLTFEFKLPRVRGKKLINSLDAILQKIDQPITHQIKIKKNIFVSENHREELMIQKLKAYL